MMKPLAQYPIEDLKKIYLTLDAQLADHPELANSELLHDLKTLLEARAKAEGINVELQAQWMTWLQGGVKLHRV